jgi:outer membrane biosynthesis protein TonB
MRQSGHKYLKLSIMNKFITSIVSAAALALPLVVSAQAVAPATMPVAPTPQVAPAVQAPQAAPAPTYKAEPYVAPKADKKAKKKKHKKAKKAKKAKAH